MRNSIRAAAVLTVASVGVGVACGGSEQKPPKAPVGSNIKGQMSADDRSRCDFKNRTDRDVVETTGPGAIQPNIRRVFAIVGEGEDTRRVLLCREVDTNLDGVKDVVRTYTDKGEVLKEQADSDYDGKVDTWITFSRGRMAKVELDSNRSGSADQTRFYLNGKLSRVQRDRNHDGKADVWEIYDAKGRLQRMGVDIDNDGHVDRWDRDKAERERELAEERAEEEAEAADAGAASDAATDAYVSARNR